MKTKIATCAIAILSVIATAPSFADGDSDAILARNALLQEMMEKEQQLKLRAEMSKHYSQMQEAGFFVDENGNPLGVPDLTKFATDMMKNGKNSSSQQGQAGQPNDPFAGFGPVVPREAVFGNQTLPTLGDNQANNNQGNSGNQSNQMNNEDAEDEDRINLVEIGANSIIVDTHDGYQELRNGQKVGKYKLSRFTIDKAFFTHEDGTSKVVAIDWTKSKRFADD